MRQFAGRADVAAVEAEGPWESCDRAATIHQLLSRTEARFGTRPGLSFQLTSGPKDASETLSWAEVAAKARQAANLFRSLGVGEGDVVAFVLPNTVETALVLLGGAIAGIVNPVNPLLDPSQMAAILRETGAKVVVTLRAFPKTDIAARVAEAVALAPGVTTVLEVDLGRYLTLPRRWIVPLVRPRQRVTHQAKVLDFTAECARQPRDLTFEDRDSDRVGALFHTGGTTGMPKVARHRVSGMVYNGWLGATLLFDERDVGMCPLPLFHVLAAYPVLMSFVTAGAHLVLPTPAGYRGEGVFDNLWSLIGRWRATFLFTVPTALAALMQRPVDADVSTLRGAFSGSAPLPLDLYRRFEAATGVQVIEGYGLTECTCVVSINPALGTKKAGSVGLPLPYSEVRILRGDGQGCGTDEVGEICVASPGVYPGATYTDATKNRDLYADARYLRTGDLGRIDADGYLFITGRAKDLIIRGGHNIDPALIEDALMGIAGVSYAGAVGQPDARAGEMPCAYVELEAGSPLTVRDLAEQVRARIGEPAAMPKHIEIVQTLPKTAVGKIFKPDLRRMAITRVFDAALEAAGQGARVDRVAEDPSRGLVARITRPEGVDAARVAEVLDAFPSPWDWV